MPSTNDDSPPEPFDACLAAILGCAIAGAIIFTHDLSMHTRPPEGRSPILVLSFTYGVLPSAGAILRFAYPKFEWRLVDRWGLSEECLPSPSLKSCSDRSPWPPARSMTCGEIHPCNLPTMQQHLCHAPPAPSRSSPPLRARARMERPADECPVLVTDLPL